MSEKILLTIAVVFWRTLASASTPGDINSCQVLDTPGTYRLTADIASISGDCFVITANNVTLNGNGHQLAGDLSGNGISATGVRNVSITNIHLKRFHTGVSFEGVSSSLISHSWFESNNNAGVLLCFNSNSNLISNSSFVHNGMGLSLESNADYNTLLNNNQSDSDIAALSIGGFSDHNNTTNNLASANARGLVVESSSSQNHFQDSEFSGSVYEDVFLNSEKGDSIDIIMLNVSYDGAKEVVDPGSQLWRKWYIDISVLKQGQAPVANAQVNAYYVAGPLLDSKLTDNSGKARLVIVDYVNNNGGWMVNFSPYTVTVAAAGYQPASQSFTINSNLNLVAQMSKSGTSTIAHVSPRPVRGRPLK